MTRTGTFATAEEVTVIKTARDKYAFQPLAARISPQSPPKGESASELVHAAALKHGLEEIEGYYDIDLSSREFVRF